MKELAVEVSIPLRGTGFEIPLNAWFRGPLGRLLQDSLARTNGPLANILDTRRIQALLAQHQAGWAVHGQTLWNLLVLQQWSERFLRGGAFKAAGPLS